MVYKSVPSGSNAASGSSIWSCLKNCNIGAQDFLLFAYHDISIFGDLESVCGFF